MSTTELEAAQARDRGWAIIRNFKAELERMAKRGPTEIDDGMVVEMVMNLVLAELKYREIMEQRDSEGHPGHDR